MFLSKFQCSEFMVKNKNEKQKQNTDLKEIPVIVCLKNVRKQKG